MSVNGKDGAKDSLPELEITVWICCLSGKARHRVNWNVAVVWYTNDAGSRESGNPEFFGKGCGDREYSDGFGCSNAT